jgi:hypothetical protein
VARYAVYLPDLDYVKWVSYSPVRASIDYDYVDDDVLGKSKVRDGKLVVPSGAAYEALILPVDQPAMRKKFAGLRILTGDLPADDAPTRWKLDSGEFRFYFNDTDSAKEYVLGPGSFELWDVVTGQIAPYVGDHLKLEPGEARLLLIK